MPQVHGVGYTDTMEENIYINRNPVTSVSQIQYYDGDNVLQTLSTSNYIVDTKSKPGRIYVSDLEGTYTRPNAVEVTFVAGYADIDAVPEEYNRPQGYL